MATPANKPRRPTRATTTAPGRRSWSAPWPTAARASTSRGTTGPRYQRCEGTHCGHSGRRDRHAHHRTHRTTARPPARTDRRRARRLVPRPLPRHRREPHRAVDRNRPRRLPSGAGAVLPGALGTIINNLAALGVGRIVPVAVIGDDGEGYELRQALARMPAVDASHVFSDPTRRTPTYTKPMLNAGGVVPRELNRLDIKHRTPTPASPEDR